MDARLVAICICPLAKGPMQYVQSVQAVAGAGLEGDRYATGEGSFNRGEKGKRQVTLMNARFFPHSGFEFVDSRRNLFVEGVELMWLIGREFEFDSGVRMRGIKYCDPCMRPTKLSGKTASFKEQFQDLGGLVAEILVGGELRVGGVLIPPPKGY